MNKNTPKNCWIISSGQIGCDNQCIGLADELNFNYEIKENNNLFRVERNNAKFEINHIKVDF